MRPEEGARLTCAPEDIARALEDIPAGRVAAIHHEGGTAASPLLTPLEATADGKGRLETYGVFPGVTACFFAFLSPSAAFHHPPASTVLALCHCRAGRMGWNLGDGTALYLGAGDLTAHSAARCADSVLAFPAGYAAGLSLAIDLALLDAQRPQALQALDFQALGAKLRVGKPLVLPARPELEWIFSPLYNAPPGLRLPYLQLKAQELLLYLSAAPAAGPEPDRYPARQTALIQDIHRQLTEHLDRRYTIEELSRQYLINTSTLKEVFKAVYGLPIASYMKEYRARRAMELLRQTDESVADIAARVGYETQGKFAKAFKDVAQMLPTEYRRHRPR